MSGETLSHPAPRRDAANPALLFLGLASGPAAWIGQLAAGYAISSLACFPHDAPVTTISPPGWHNEPALLVTLNLLALAVASAGVALSWWHWRRTRAEKPGEAQATLDIGEGRTRFLATCGMLMGAGFVVAILFDTAFIVGTPTCWGMA